MRFGAIVSLTFNPAARPTAPLLGSRVRVAKEPRCTPHRGRNQEWDMDLIMVGLTVAFFALSFAYIQTCSKL